jgi:NTP pyrophosphatase (non-canonical NTP hydrolase)
MDIKGLQELVVKFRDDRDWKQFHNPKDCALSLVLEATEVLEHFQWKNGEEITQYLEEGKESISHELADVLYWILLMSHDLDIDITEVFEKKLKMNGEKYPIEKAKGKSDKYTKI